MDPCTYIACMDLGMITAYMDVSLGKVIVWVDLCNCYCLAAFEGWLTRIALLHSVTVKISKK